MEVGQPAEAVPQRGAGASRTPFDRVILGQVDVGVRQGLLDADPARLAPTPQGQRFLNDLLTLFLRDAGQAAPYATET